MRNINEFLKEVQKEFPDELAGKASNGGGFDGPPLPEDRQYRATITRAEWRQATGSGKYSYAITFEVTEPAEWAGRKFSEYYSIDSGNRIAAEKFSKLIGESGINVAEADTSSNEAFAKSFEGAEFVVATRTWGEDDDKTGLRYLNRDRGQALKDKIDPPKKKKVGSSLVADIQIKKDQAPGPFDGGTAEAEEEATAPAQAPVSLPGGARPSGVNLPPGLRPS